MELLERERPLGALRECPPGHVVLVAGEAGIGKTSLLRAFCAADRRPNLWGGCDALRTPRPLGPLRDIARQAGGELARAMAADSAGHELFSALLDELTARPTVAVIEDVHWADEATLDLLVFLGRRIHTTESLLIVTYRDDEVDAGHPLRGVLGELARQREVLRVDLAPLSAAAVAALAAPRGLDADALYAHTAGNPFFVTEVLADPDPAVPSTVRDAVLARAARLDASARDALYAVAIFPGHAPVPLIQASPEAIDACVGAGVLTRDGARIRFRHELARLAIDEAAPPGRRAALHARALTDLRGRAAEPAQLAYHAEEAGDGGAVQLHAKAAAHRATILGAHRQAADHYAQLLRFGDGLSGRLRAEVLDEYAETCSRLDWEQEAVDLSGQALACWREEGDREREAATLARRAHYLWQHIGDGPAARTSIKAALDLAAQLPPGPGTTAVYTWSAVLLMLGRDTDAAVATGQRAAAMAERFGQTAMQSRALNAVGTARWLTDPAEAERTLIHSLDVACRSGNDTMIGVALVNLGSGAGEARLYATAERWLREAVDWCSKRDMDSLRRYAAAWLARCYLERGLWPRAMEVIENTESYGYSCGTTVRLTTLGRLRARRGELGAAEALDEACALAAKLGELQYIWPAEAARAELAWLNGEPPDTALYDAYRFAVRLDHCWAIGELGQWLDPVERGEQYAAAAEPYRLTPVASAKAWDELGCPYEAALALSSSPEHWDEALARLERLGARPAADLVARRVREAGQRPRRRSTLAHPHGLTERQAAVLDLVGEGLQNTEIAERLHITAKTVDHHVSAILAKLGVGSRREAARLVHAAGTR